MAKHGKNYKGAAEKVDSAKLYAPKEAMELAKELSSAKFDETVEVAVRLGVDTRQGRPATSAVPSPCPTAPARPSASPSSPRAPRLPRPRRPVLTSSAPDELVAQIAAGNIEFDAAIATPNMMGKVGRLGKILGPRGLMPNPKLGTVTMDVAKMVAELKAGRVEYRADRYGICHVPMGKASLRHPRSSSRTTVLSTPSSCA